MSSKRFKVRLIGSPRLNLRRLAADSSQIRLVENSDDEIDAIVLEVADQRDIPHQLRTLVRRNAPILLVSSDKSSRFLAAATRAGAAGVLDPQADESTLHDALETVTAGGTYASMGRVLDFVQRARVREEALEAIQLTPRELNVLELLAVGMSARQIASHLSLSERTVNTHVAKLYRKLGVSNRVEAIRAGIRMGLVSMTE